MSPITENTPSERRPCPSSRGDRWISSFSVLGPQLGYRASQKVLNRGPRSRLWDGGVPAASARSLHKSTEGQARSLKGSSRSRQQMVLLTPFWASGEQGVSWAPSSRPAGQRGPGVPSPGRPDSPAHSLSPITCPGQGQTHTQDTQRLLPSVCRSVAQSCPTLCDPVDCSSPGLPVHHQLPEFTQLTSVESVMPSSLSSSVIPFSSRLQPFPASGPFPKSQPFASGGQSIGASSSVSVLPVNIQG